MAALCLNAATVDSARLKFHLSPKFGQQFRLARYVASECGGFIAPIAALKCRGAVAAQHADIVQRMLALAEQCRADLGDTVLGRKGAGVREPGGVKE